MRRLTLTWLVPLVLLLAWWLVTHFGLISPLFLPSPSLVAGAAQDVGLGIGAHAFATLLRLVVGFSIGCCVGYCVGVLMALYPHVKAVLRPIVDGGRPAPMTATLPFFLLWFGFSWYGQIAFIALGVALVIASGVLDASNAVEPQLIRAAQTFNASKWQLARSVLMPGLLPQLVPTLRICLGIAGSLTVVSEFMGADAGLGTMLDVSRRTLRTEALIYFSFVLAALVLLCDAALRGYLAYKLRWMPSSSEAMDVPAATTDMQPKESGNG